jgi:hypothetical protein
MIAKMRAQCRRPYLEAHDVRRQDCGDFDPLKRLDTFIVIALTRLKILHVGMHHTAR